MKLYLKALAIFLSLSVLSGAMIWNRYQTLRTEHLNMRQSTFHSTYNGILNTYRLVSQTLYDELLNQPDTLQLLHRIVTSNAAERNHARGLLYRKLAPMYERISQHSIRQFHFHFPDNHSMLRLHAPHLADDDLSGSRPSVVKANSEGLEVHGYESGRIVHGFRHVYPLFYNNSAVGSVEISNSFQQLRQELLNNDGSDYLFMMLKSDLWHKLAAEQQQHYVPALLDQEYLSENLESDFYTQQSGHTPDPEYLLGLQRHLHADPQLKNHLESGESFTLTTVWQRQQYSILFHSIKNIGGEHAAYILCIHPEPALLALKLGAGGQLLFAVLASFALAMCKANYDGLRNRQQSSAQFLQTISDHMGEGLYTTDKHGNITLFNPEASRILGISELDALDKSAHQLFHVDDSQHREQGCIILNALLKNQTCRHQRATFRHADQRQFPVELTCTPTVHRGETTGTITLFHDISSRLAHEKTLLEMQQLLVKSNEQLSKLARIDALTGLANRREFDETLNRLWKTALRNQTNLAVLMIDIDQFKSYNDHYGHPQGDVCLQKIALLIQRCCLRPADVVARYGGEEFVVLLPDTSMADACQVAKRISREVHRERITHLASARRFVTLSIGVYSEIPSDDSTAQNMTDCADRLLYQAKKLGRDQICNTILGC